MIRALARPIDKAILIYFRFMTGVLMSQELINGLMIGKLSEFTRPSFHFSYLFFEWLKPWPYQGMIIHYTLTILAGYAVALGLWYRLSATILFLGYSSLFLMEKSLYINHNYLYSLISFCMIWLPLKNDGKSTAPAWVLYLILFHMCLAYCFGGIAKLNSDWLTGTPMDIYLSLRKNYLLGFIYSQKWAPLFFSYGGVLFDLLVVPLMILPKTRKLGLIFSILFHSSNVFMFGLATFPWYSMVLTTMFFNPSWPREIPVFKKFLPEKKREPEKVLSPLLLTCLGLYFLLHVSLPWRHFLYPGNTSWTEEGHMFSWRMMLRQKMGKVQFHVHAPKTQQFFAVSPKRFLTERQTNAMVGNPDSILQFAHFLKRHYEKELKTKVSVFASSRVSLNGREALEMIKPGTDLTKEERTLKPYKWVQPLP